MEKLAAYIYNKNYEEYKEKVRKLMEYCDVKGYDDVVIFTDDKKCINDKKRHAMGIPKDICALEDSVNCGAITKIIVVNVDDLDFNWNYLTLEFLATLSINDCKLETIEMMEEPCSMDPISRLLKRYLIKCENEKK